MRELLVTPRFRKDLKSVPPKIKEQADALLFLLRENPVSPGLNIKKLEGREGFRLRIGGYRAIYRRLNDTMVIDVINVGSRGDIYK